MAPCCCRELRLLSHQPALRKGLRLARALFWLAMTVTLVSLLTPADAVLAVKVWVASWLPMASALDAADVTAHSDKLVHAGLFALLGWLGARSWSLPPQRWRLVVGLLLLGVLTEALQSLIPGRSASLGDWLADAVGVFSGLLCGPSAIEREGVPDQHGAQVLCAEKPPILRVR